MGFGGGALDRRTALGEAHGSLQDRDVQRRARDLRDHGGHLLYVHDDRRLRRAGPGRGLEAGRLDPARHPAEARDSGAMWPSSRLGARRSSGCCGPFFAPSRPRIASRSPSRDD